MKIAILGDMHLGAFQNSERSEDSFTQGKEAIELALKENADLILITGDIFDSRIPSQDVLGKTLQIFSAALNYGNKGIEITQIINKDKGEISKISLFGTPIIALNGNHDRRGKGLTNPVELLEKAGLLIHLSCSTIVLRKAKSEQRIAIHGMSYIPEKYARDVLERWAPKPVKNACNILLMHQNIGQYVYSEEESAMLKIEDLPAGFDLIVNGHIHWNDYFESNSMKLLLPGSTISTQLHSIEAKKPKAIHIFDGNKLSAVSLQTQRKLFYETLNLSEIEPDELHKKIKEKILRLGQMPDARSPKPLVRLVLKGTIKKGFEASDLNLHKIEEEFSSKFILHIGREKLVSRETAETRGILEQLLKKQVSIEERGLEILQQALSETEFKDVEITEQFLNTLIESDVDSAYKFLKEKFTGVK